MESHTNKSRARSREGGRELRTDESGRDHCHCVAAFDDEENCLVERERKQRYYSWLLSQREEARGDPTSKARKGRFVGEK